MDSFARLRDIRARVFIDAGIRSSLKQKRSDMNATAMAVDLDKSGIEIAVADEH